MKSRFPLPSAVLPLLGTILLAAASPLLAQEPLPDLVRRLKPNVVAIATFDARGEALMTGSGFFIRPGEVITNLHVVRGAARAEIRTLEGKGRVYPINGATAVDEEGDLALLSVEMPAERQRQSDVTTTLPEEGESIVVIGNPLRLEGSVSDGIVSAVREVPGVGRIIQITAPISHGNSGSPVFNMKGQVIGVVTVKVTNGQNINLAISSARVESMRAGQLRALASIQGKDKVGDRRDGGGESLYRAGLDSLWLGNYDNALGYFEHAVNQNPRRADAWVQVGYCKVKQGKSQEAVRAYQQALQLQPNSADVHNKLGDAYYYAGRLREAIASYSAATRLAPHNAEFHYNLALAYGESGDHHRALATARVLKQLDEKLYRKWAADSGLGG